jgi:hypothetical protein
MDKSQGNSIFTEMFIISFEKYLKNTILSNALRLKYVGLRMTKTQYSMSVKS